MGRKLRMQSVKGVKKSPNVSARMQINAAIADWKNGLLKKDACLQNGVSRPTLNRYIKFYNIRDKSARDYDIIPIGRPNIVNIIVSAMKESVAKAKRTLKQMHTERSYTADAKVELQNLQTNAIMPLRKISRSTYNRAYSLSCGSEKIKCSDSFAGRAQAIMDWRNAIGCACTWFTLLHIRNLIKPWNLWSGDDVAVVLNPDTQKLQIVRITKAERERFNKLHLTPGAKPVPRNETEADNVVCKCFNMVNAEGTRGPVTAKLLDYNFKWADPDKFMAIYCVNEDMHLYVACVNKKHAKYCEIEYFEELMIKVIVPFVCEHRDKKSGTGRGFVDVSSQQSAEDESSTQLVVHFGDGERIVFTLDGNYPGIEAILRRVGAVMNANGIEGFKWAGGCTLTEQPADVADTHKQFHKAAAGETLKNDEHGAPSVRMVEFIAFLHTICSNTARLHTHERFLRHFEWMVDTAWSKHDITEGWRISGLWPYDASKILAGWGGWELIPTGNAQEIVRLCTDMDGDAFHEIAKTKYLDDLTAQAIFGDLIEDEDFKDYMTDKQPTNVPTNMRCLMLNTKSFDTDVSFMEQIWQHRQLTQARLQAALGEVLGGVQMCICGAKMPKDVGKHLDTTGHKSNCRRKGVTDVAALLPEPVFVAPEVPAVQDSVAEGGEQLAEAAAADAAAAPAYEAVPQTPPQSPLIRDAGGVPFRSRHRSRMQAMEIESNGRVQYGYRPGVGAIFVDGDESAANEDFW